LHITKLARLSDTKHVAELGDWVRVDQRSAKPLFDQLRTQIIDGIRDGKLPPGTRLPTVRELAGQMGLAVNTVARAYRELESAGILETRGRFGTFVARVDPADTAMATAAHAFVSAARALGIEKDEALNYVDAAFG
jgi:DNA-binding transcriptional regulator YhcF (GntR family)